MHDKLHTALDRRHSLQEPEQEAGEFSITLGKLEIGTLSYDPDGWVFRYSDAFQCQSLVKPIMDFPKLEKEYRSKLLWPFFLIRIPSLNQPYVKQFIAEHGLGEPTQATLLRQFGRRAAANPFELIKRVPL